MFKVSSEYSFKTKTNSNFAINLAEMLKEATIHFCLFGESHFANMYRNV